MSYERASAPVVRSMQRTVLAKRLIRIASMSDMSAGKECTGVALLTEPRSSRQRTRLGKSERGPHTALQYTGPEPGEYWYQTRSGLRACMSHPQRAFKARLHYAGDSSVYALISMSSLHRCIQRKGDKHTGRRMAGRISRCQRTQKEGGINKGRSHTQTPSS